MSNRSSQSHQTNTGIVTLNCTKLSSFYILSGKDAVWRASLNKVQVNKIINTRLHGVTTQKTTCEFFTTMRTSNLTNSLCFQMSLVIHVLPSVQEVTSYIHIKSTDKIM